jgi:hypothetical protein
VAQLGRELDSAELSEWMAYDQLHPFPDPWLQTGVQASLTANLGKDPKNRKRYKPQDFMPQVKARRKRMTIEQIRSAMISMSVQAPAPAKDKEAPDG